MSMRFGLVTPRVTDSVMPERVTWRTASCATVTRGRLGIQSAAHPAVRHKAKKKAVLLIILWNATSNRLILNCLRKAQIIALNGHYTQRHYPDHLRRIRFKDAETDKTLVFLTNQTLL